MRPVFEVADILKQNINRINDIATNSWQTRTLYAIANCRTYLLGGHIDKCSNHNCNHLHISYNSCRNRHCPKCQGNKREEWIQARESELLNIPYYHIVFTIPHMLNKICLFEPRIIYSLLFKTAWSVINDFAKNPKFLGAKTGMIAILHTWGQNLSLHPHLHCIVPGGGISPSLKWKHAKGKDKFLFPVKAMSNVFRARFVELLRKNIEIENNVYNSLFSKNWVVYCKRPFFGPKQVVEYLGRYTHKIAISNNRIKDINNSEVTFFAKNYRNGGKTHLISLSHIEFIRRFSLHILPKGFTRIRHYGFLCSSRKKVILPILQKELGHVTNAKNQNTDTVKHNICRVCGIGKLLTVCTFDARGPPFNWKEIFEINHNIMVTKN